MIATTGTRIRWAVASAVGLAAGATLSGLVVTAVGRSLSPLLGGLLYVGLYGTVIGCVAGTVQLAVIPRDAARWYVWPLASIAGFGAGYMLASLVGETLGNAIDPGLNVIVGEGTIEVTAGAVLGVAIGITQWRVLRQVLPSLKWWLVATAVGAGLGYGSAAAVLELFDVVFLKANLVPAFGAIVGLFVGVAQAIVLRSAP
jgi:hypothetical protein